MTIKRTLIFFGLLTFALLVSACSGSRFTASSWPGITYDIESETIYVAYQQQVYALDKEGDEIWRFPEKANARVTFFAAPTITSDGLLLAGGYDNILYAIAVDDGSEEWRFENAHNRWIASPFILDGMIYAPNANHTLYALNTDGDVDWSFEAEQPMWATPISNGEIVYQTTLAGKVFALTAKSADEEAEPLYDAIELDGAIVGTPALGPDGTLYVGSFGNQVAAIDGPTGDLKWTFDTKDWVWAPPALIQGTLYVSDLTGTIYALDPSNGRTIWTTDLKTAILGAPVLLEGKLYAGTEAGDVYAIDMDGSVKKIHNTNGSLYGTPVVVDDLLVFGVVSEETEYILVAMDTTGLEQWSFTPQSE
jgi:outer membrane protein assembly factor BamB